MSHELNSLGRSPAKLIASNFTLYNCCSLYLLLARNCNVVLYELKSFCENCEAFRRTQCFDVEKVSVEATVEIAVGKRLELSFCLTVCQTFFYCGNRSSLRQLLVRRPS